MDRIDTRAGGQPIAGRAIRATETSAEYFSSVGCQHPVGLLPVNICVRRVADIKALAYHGLLVSRGTLAFVGLLNSAGTLTASGLLG